MRPSAQFPADLVTFTDEILNGKLHFLCGVSWISWTYFSEYPTENNLLMPWRRFDFTLQRERFIISLLNFSTIDNVKRESFEIGLCFTRNLTFWFPSIFNLLYCQISQFFSFLLFLKARFFQLHMNSKQKRIEGNQNVKFFVIKVPFSITHL